MKKILVPCDFSTPALEAYRFALDIAGRSKGAVILLNTIELPLLYDTTLMPALYFEEQTIKDIKASAEKQFRNIRSKWSKAGVKVTSQVTYGPVAETIIQFAKDQKADLIVMGTQGASGIKEYFIGSNTEKVVRRSGVPVISIKKYAGISAIQNIVFPNALDEDQEDLTLKVKAVQEFFKAKLHILFVNTPVNFRHSNGILKDLEAFAKRFMFKDYTLNIFNDLDQESGVIHFAQEAGADLIAMGTHGRRGLNHLVSGSVAEDVVNHITCPIWTCVEK